MAERERESLPERSDFQERRDDLHEKTTVERDRVDQREPTTVEAFNEHMNQLCNVLDYKNVARVWIEHETESGTRRDDQSASFGLHVGRETDVAMNLIESERELIRLVVGLAGYLVHEVYNEVPFILLDSVESIGSDRIARPVQYDSTYPTYLIVTLLPEDVALDDDVDRVAPSVFSV